MTRLADVRLYDANKRIDLTVTLAPETCCTCGVPFAMPADLQAAAKQDAGLWFYCPNGHRQHYTESDADKLRRELADHKRWLEASRAAAQAAQDQLVAAGRSAAAARGQLTKLRNRVGNGVCPCCKRTFAQLARHMAAKHPEWKEPPA